MFLGKKNHVKEYFRHQKSYLVFLFKRKIVKLKESIISRCTILVGKRWFSLSMSFYNSVSAKEPEWVFVDSAGRRESLSQPAVWWLLADVPKAGLWQGHGTERADCRTGVRERGGGERINRVTKSQNSDYSCFRHAQAPMQKLLLSHNTRWHNCIIKKNFSWAQGSGSSCLKESSVHPSLTRHPLQQLWLMTRWHRSICFILSFLSDVCSSVLSSLLSGHYCENACAAH